MQAIILLLILKVYDHELPSFAWYIAWALFASDIIMSAMFRAFLLGLFGY